MCYKVEDVFSPRSFPENTYIHRITAGNKTIDQKLEKALMMKGNLIFVSGASKSGKTVLCHKVIPDEKFIDLSGNQISSKEDFWNHIAEQLSLSDIVTTTTGMQNSEARVVKGSANFNAGIMGTGIGAGIGADTSENVVSTNQITASRARTETQIIRYIIDNDKVLVIDDFHYIPKEIQLYIARTLKTELFHGLKAVILSLPHRSDEAIILNPDLIGRTTSIEIPLWTTNELKEIAVKGFTLLNVPVSDECISLLAQESISSPQLMQDNCFNLAYGSMGSSITTATVKAAFSETASNYAHYDKLVNTILHGPSQGQGRRKLYQTADKDVDIYELMLLALKADPPVSKLSLEEIKNRISELLVNHERITSSIISGTINKLISLIKKDMPDLDALEYKNKELYILDPFLLFYLRWKN